MTFLRGLKLKEKKSGPYSVAAVEKKNRYDVEKVGIHEGTSVTSSAEEYLKP